MSIVALFDMSGISVRPWAIAGEECFCFDILNDGRMEKFASGGSITFLKWNARDPSAKAKIREVLPQFIIGFPPCTDLAVSGAGHFETKKFADPAYRLKAISHVLMIPDLAKECGCSYIIENPVGVLSSIWRKPNYIFNPCDFGCYLPPEDKHPTWPQYIEPRDAYNKKTCIWTDGKIKWPKEKRVRPVVITDSRGHSWSKQAASLGGGSRRTKEIRSLTPRGFAIAFCLANYEFLLGRPIPDYMQLMTEWSI